MPPPFPTPVHQNGSVEMIMNWKDSGAPTKSDAEVNWLVKDVLLDPKFKPENLRGFSIARENSDEHGFYNPCGLAGMGLMGVGVGCKIYTLGKPTLIHVGLWVYRWVSTEYMYL